MKHYPDIAGHRGVETSIAAGEALNPKLGRLQRIALAAIKEAGHAGLTFDELAEVTGLARYSAQPRTSELKRKGLICDSGKRRKSIAGLASIVWVVKPHDKAA